ncbi:MAG: hypothetical protein OET79_14370 [Nitrospirota bacterium]|nr:hypothetical protein [Nitrospirota bacterium]
MTTRLSDITRCTIRPLGAGQIHQAFGLLEISDIPMSLEQWLTYARRHITASPSASGIISAQCPRAYIHGLYSYETIECKAEKHMVIDLFIVPNQFGQHIGESLIDSAERIARKYLCSRISLDFRRVKAADVIAISPKPLVSLCRGGYSIDSVQLSKKL